MPEKDQSISVLHGKALDAIAAYGPIKIVPLYHPAVVLYNVNSRKILEEDFKIIKRLI